MDTQSDSSGALDTNQAASLFASMLDPQPVADKVEPEATAIEPEASAEDAQANPDAEAEAQTEDDPTVTVKVDGQDIEVKLSELKGSYQKDKAASQRFEQAAELRKQADAETQKARQERQTYAQNLQAIAQQAHAALQQQQQIDWDALKQNDPVEFVNQVRLAQERQAVLARSSAELQRVSAVDAQERDAEVLNLLASEGEQLLQAIPDWKDPEKKKAGEIEVFNHLVKLGFDPEQFLFKKDASTGRIVNPGITNHRLVLMARESMLYQQMVAKANAAAKKVRTLPTKVERAGNGQNPGLDRRSSAFQNLSKSGRVEDAAAVFAGLL